LCTRSRLRPWRSPTRPWHVTLLPLLFRHHHAVATGTLVHEAPLNHLQFVIAGLRALRLLEEPGDAISIYGAIVAIGPLHLTRVGSVHASVQPRRSRGSVPASKPGSEDLPERQERRRERSHRLVHGRRRRLHIRGRRSRRHRGRPVALVAAPVSRHLCLRDGFMCTLRGRRSRPFCARSRPLASLLCRRLRWVSVGCARAASQRVAWYILVSERGFGLSQWHGSAWHVLKPSKCCRVLVWVNAVVKFELLWSCQTRTDLGCYQTHPSVRLTRPDI